MTHFGKHGIALLVFLGGCGTAHLSIIGPYYSNVSADAIALEIETTDPQIDQFVSELLRYADAQNLDLVSAELATNANVSIVISNNDQTVGTNSGQELVRSFLPETDSLAGKANPVPTYRAELKTREGIRNKVYFTSLKPSIAELLIDELLLLWHPPLVDKHGKSNVRAPVPEYALQPTFYEVSQSFFGSDPAGTNYGWQAWYELESTRPTFTWEAFPRNPDFLQDIEWAGIKNVNYDFRLYRVQPDATGFMPVGDKSTMITRNGLSTPSFTPEQDLEHCRRYMWTVRANFELDGAPRHTEWAGAYNISTPIRPWYWRRDVSRPLAMEPYPGMMFFTVVTPKSPFAGECEF
jgi:hypothetical protein